MEVWSGTMGSHCFLSHQLLFSMKLNLGLSGKCFLKPNCFSCSPGCPALPPVGLALVCGAGHSLGLGH